MEKVKQIFCADKNICPVIAKQNAQKRWELWALSNCLKPEKRKKAKYESRLFEGHMFDAVEATNSTTGRTLIKVLEDGIWHDIVFIQPPIVADGYMSAIWQYSIDTTPMWIKYFRIDKETETLESMLERGAGIKTILIDLTDAADNTLLENAEKMIPITEYFLKKGIDANEKDEWGNTALINACRSGYETIMKLLLDNGANVNDKTNDGQTALMYASQYKWDAKWLLEKGANVNEKDKWGNTALTYAFDESNFDGVRLLLNHGSDINGLKYEFTGFDWDGCCMCEVIKIIEHCLMENIDLNSKDEEGMTLFMRLAGTKTVCRYFEGANRGFEFFEFFIETQMEALNLLLKNGADINAKSKDGKTALHYANDYTDFECDEIVQKHPHQLTKWLVKKGADVHATDNDSKTALTYAKEAGLKLAAKYLMYQAKKG